MSTYYVATAGGGGDNGNPGTEAQPWLTIDYAAGQVSPGDTVYVRGGTYNEVVTLAVSGTSGNYITFQNYTGETPIVDGDGLGIGYGLVEIRHPTGGQPMDYIIWDGIDVYRSAEKGIAVGHYRDCDNIIIRNCKIYTHQYSGISLYAYSGEAITNITIDNVEITDCNLGNVQEAVTIAGTGVDTVEVKNCTIHDNFKEGLDAKNGVTNVSIHDNTAYNQPGVCFYADGASSATSNIDIYNNIAYNSTGPGIDVSCENVGTLTTVNVYNNLVYNCKDGFHNLQYASGGNITDLHIYCNTFADNTRYQLWIQEDDAVFTGLVIANNILEHDTAALVFRMDDQANLEANQTLDENHFGSGSGFGTNITTGDPLFVQQAGSNYQLAIGSPCLDDVNATYVPSTDILGTARPQGAVADKGAYERIPTGGWLGTWANRIKLSIDNTDVTATLTDFPVRVLLSTASGISNDDVSAIFDELASDANRKKIAVTTNDGLTQCYVEIANWDDASEKADLWVKVPSISSSADTDLYLYYDAAQSNNTAYVEDTADGTGNVWASKYKFAFLGYDGADTGHIYDSTGNSNDGTKTSAGNPAEATGIVGQAQQFSSDVIDIGSGVSLESMTARSVLVYMKHGGFTGAVRQVFYGAYFHANYGDMIDLQNTADNARIYLKNNAGTVAFNAGLAFTANTPVMLGYTWNGTTVNYFVDGADVGGSDSLSGTLDCDAYNHQIGAYAGSLKYYDGLIELVVVANAALSAAEVKAWYESSRDNFIEYGAAESTGWSAGNILGLSPTSIAKIDGVARESVSKYIGV